MINSSLIQAVPTRIVEMLTVEKGNTPLSQYNSDDLKVMQEVMKNNFKCLSMPELPT